MAETLRRLASLENALSQNEIESKTVFPCRFKEGTSEDADKSIEFDVLQSSPIAKCETQADIQSKAATVSNFPDFTLVNGREVVVWFAYQNAVANPTLNINNTGDIEIVVDGLNDELEIPVELWKAESFVRFKYVSVTIGTTTISKWVLGASTSSIYDALKDFSGVTPITQEEYDALPEEEKMADKLYLIQNPSDGGFIAITDDVQAGNMNAITSNAVNNALTDYTKKDLLFSGRIAQSNYQVTLPHSIFDYDIIVFGHRREDTTYWQSTTFCKEEIAELIDSNNQFMLIYGWGNETEYVGGYFSADGKTLNIRDYRGVVIRFIKGFKFGN